MCLAFGLIFLDAGNYVSACLSVNAKSAPASSPVPIVVLVCCRKVVYTPEILVLTGLEVVFGLGAVPVIKQLTAVHIVILDLRIK